MRVPVGVIVEALDSYGPELGFVSEEAVYAKLKLLRRGRLRPDTLYVGRGADLLDFRRPADCAVICIGQPAVNQHQTIVLPDTCDLYEVFNRLQDLFTSLADYEVELAKAASTGSYQEMIDICYRVVGNPLVLLDSAFRVHAITDVDIPGDREWAHLRTEGSSSAEVLRVLKEQGRLFAETPERIYVFTSPYTPNRCFAGRTYVNGRITGRIVAIETFKPISSLDKHLLMTLMEALEMKMTGDEVFQGIRGKGPVYSMLQGLLQGLRFEPSLITETLQLQPRWTKGLFRVLFVPLGGTDGRTFDFYANVMEKKLDSLAVLLKNALVAVLHYERKDCFERLRGSLVEFLTAHSLQGGMSYEFENLSCLSGSYYQAVAGLDLSEENSVLHLYSDHALKHIFSIISKQNMPLVRHPSLLRLKQFDEKNGTQLFETFHAFLRNERSLVKTAEVLHIHRNTLVYRINKIADMVDVDLENEDNRLHLLISYRM